MGETIAILSGKGGTGKTSVCALLATALADAGQKVLCIDCDMGLRNLDISLGLAESGALSFLDVAQGGYRLDQAAKHHRYPTLRFLTAPISQSAEDVDTDRFRALLEQAREIYDYIFLDAPAGVDAGFRLAARYAGRVILVTGADPAAVRDAERAGQLLDLMGKDNVRLVVNRIRPKLLRAMDLTVDDVMDSAGLPLLGLVPEDPNVVLAATFGQPLLQYSKRCSASRAGRRIAKRMMGISVPLTL